MYRKLSILLLLTLFSLQLKAQGCSDAGICSMPHIDSLSHGANSHSQLSLEQTFELGEQNTFYLHTVMSVSQEVSNRIALTAMLPFRNTYYKTEWYNYLSDITLALHLQAFKNIQFTAGVKLPVGTVTAKSSEGKDLPMALQGGLGAYDLLLQSQFSYEKWSWAVGYQLPFSAINNTFEPYGDFIDFQNSYHLQRGDDFMLRYNRNWSGDKVEWLASLISTYRIKGDYIYSGQRVAGSEGLSVNVGINATRQLKRGALKARLAVPIYVRTARPDGLTRTVILGISWNGFL